MHQSNLPVLWSVICTFKFVSFYLVQHFYLIYHDKFLCLWLQWLAMLSVINNCGHFLV